MIRADLRRQFWELFKTQKEAVRSKIKPSKQKLFNFCKWELSKLSETDLNETFGKHTSLVESWINATIDEDGWVYPEDRTVYYKVNFKNILIITDKAICLEDLNGNKVWLPKDFVSEIEDKEIAFLIPDWLYAEKGVTGTVADINLCVKKCSVDGLNKPKIIEPKYNQEAIDELKI